MPYEDLKRRWLSSLYNGSEEEDYQGKGKRAATLGEAANEDI